MNHVRIIVWKTHGISPESVSDIVEAPDGLSDIFRRTPGFQASSLVKIDDTTLLGITIWESHEEADAAYSIAVPWAAEHIGTDKLVDQASYVGDALYWNGVAR